MSNFLISKETWSANIHKALGFLGIDFRFVKNLESVKIREKQQKELDGFRILSNYEFKVILDVGANTGQFAKVARAFCPDATIYSFEPLPDIYSQLVEELAIDHNAIPVNSAISNFSGTADMFQSNFSASSSLLPMAKLHKEEMPHSASSKKVKVRIDKLDDWIIKNNVKLDHDLLIKMDVQGNELKVIEGGINVLQRAKLLIIEVSFYELYHGQALFDDIYEVLKKNGFTYKGNLGQYQSQKSNNILFADALFENARIL